METKICRKCGQEKTLNYFNATKGKNDIKYYANVCKACHVRIYHFGESNPLARVAQKLLSGQETKTCIKCGQEKPLFSFKKYKGKKDGLVRRGAKCHGCYQSPLATRRTYKPYLLKGDWVKFCASCQTVKPLEDFRRVLKSYGNCKSCHLKTVMTAYYNATPEQNQRKRERAKRFSASPKGIKLRATRRARLRGAEIVIKFHKSEIIKRDGLACYLCGKKLTEKTAEIEHILPLSRGGNHKPENVKLACKPCNSSKNSKTLTEYKKYRGDYERFCLLK